ncbi:hypothetical protein JAAARDRAFT_142408 [Jaapia argillacea MUCL 33604]|uniref:Uncharacterized protein n=1 Tax=Jaapia argillacea MUCL 33604 TaxID=933084 RepID=A0A067PGH0_9AGAM|nr:hypothetical protein JAAARDRAFT_142408 [Jaapia argillacea MUCL 33604]
MGIQRSIATISISQLSTNQKILLLPCGLYYLAAILLGNTHTILHQPQILQYFPCSPPTLKEYFQGGPVEDPELDNWCLQAPWQEMDVGEDEDDTEDEEVETNGPIDN